MQTVDQRISRSGSPFGQLLREFRINANLSQEMLAERARLSVAGISVLERGVRRTPHRETVALIGSALQLSPADLTRLKAAAVRTPVLRTFESLSVQPDRRSARGTAIDSRQSPALRLLDNRQASRNAAEGRNPAVQTAPPAERIAATLATAFRDLAAQSGSLAAGHNIERRLLHVVLAFEHALRAALLITQQLLESSRDEQMRATTCEGLDPGATCG